MSVSQEKFVTFSEVEIQQLFGNEAADSEQTKRLREYYFKNEIYNQVVADLPLRILVGHKGIGKSALFKVAIAEEEEGQRLTILIKPDDIANIKTSATDFIGSIRDWKMGITNLIVEKVLSKFGQSLSTSVSGTPVLGAISSILSSVLNTNNLLSGSQKNIIEQFLKKSRIYVYIDDLDRGWQGRREDIQRISALLNAARDLSSDNEGLYFRIALRSDVYFLVRTSDESTDKIEGSVIWHRWSNHQILALLVKRIETFFGRTVDEDQLMKLTQSALEQYLTPVMEKTFNGRGKWEKIPTRKVLMSLVRRRPRDMVKLCSLAARKARERGGYKISTSDLQSSFIEYSQGRLQDTINEYNSELPDIERLLMGMKPNKQEKTSQKAYVYKTDELLKKISNIEQSGRFLFANQKPADAKKLAAFMYKINFLTARKEKDSEIIRQYFEESRYLQNDFADFGFDWEVHPAYRWVLQPDRILDVLNELSPSADD